MGAAMYDPDRSAVPYGDGELAACRWQTPSPVMVGQHVQYRHTHHGDVADAIVLDVVFDSPENGIVNGMIVPLPPWPTVLLDTVHGEAKTREARARGSAGWLPLGWENTPVHAVAA